PFSLSTLSACSIREVAEKTSSPFWFQLYIVKDRDFVRTIIEQGGKAGCSALILTVYLAVPGTRYRDYRAGLSGSRGGGRNRQGLQRPRWGLGVAHRGRPVTARECEPM